MAQSRKDCAISIWRFLAGPTRVHSALWSSIYLLRNVRDETRYLATQIFNIPVVHQGIGDFNNYLEASTRWGESRHDPRLVNRRVRVGMKGQLANVLSFGREHLPQRPLYSFHSTSELVGEFFLLWD